jgi:inorganic pyrophosphatase
MSVVDLSEFPCFAEDGTTLHVIIETPKGSRNKFAYDEERKIARPEIYRATFEAAVANP